MAIKSKSVTTLCVSLQRHLGHVESIMGSGYNMDMTEASYTIRRVNQRQTINRVTLQRAKGHVRSIKGSGHNLDVTAVTGDSVMSDNIS